MRRLLVTGFVIATLLVMVNAAYAGIPSVATPCFGAGVHVQLTVNPMEPITVPGCWFLGAPGQSCTQTCAAHGLAYDDNTRTVAGSDATDNGTVCNILGNILDSPGTFANDTCATPAQPGIGCIIDPGTPPGGVRCTQPTTNADAAALDSERICACMPHAAAPALSSTGLGVVGVVLLGGGVWLLRRRGRRAA